MSIDKIIVIVVGAFATAFIYWFFLSKKDGEGAVISDFVEITVKGGYTPDTIIVPVGKKVLLNFTRRDESSCLEEIVIPDFKVRKYLPVGERVSIEILAKVAGEYPFACGMNMFHGKIIAK